MIQQTRILEQDGRFIITRSDFSELLVLDSQVNDLSSTIGFQPEQTTLKMAKFKKIDWNALDRKLAKPKGRNYHT